MSFWWAYSLYLSEWPGRQVAIVFPLGAPPPAENQLGLGCGKRNFGSGPVAKLAKAMVCKTIIRRFESGSGLVFSEGKNDPP